MSALCGCGSEVFTITQAVCNVCHIRARFPVNGHFYSNIVVKHLLAFPTKAEVVMKVEFGRIAAFGAMQALSERPGDLQQVPEQKRQRVI